MRQVYILLILLISGSIGLNAQSIRKNYLELTETERINLINAFYALRNGPDLVNDLATFHMDFFSFDNTADPTRLDIHLNLPDEPERDIFLAWHRRQMFEMEQAMQDINPRISLAYWDSSVDQSINDPIWDQDFLGQFNADWNLNRNLGGNGALPTPQEVTTVQSNTDFLTYSNAFERGTPHAGAHRWVGGVMPTSVSPRDPIFYFHHSFVDKLWQEWEEVNQSSAFIMTSMLRYDGTYVFDGETLPLVNPNDITDSRALGVFYAENGLAELDNYTVSNTHNPEETFYYQFSIEVGDNFIAPSGTSSRIESVNNILLRPGFRAESGASFVATIDTAPITNGIQGRDRSSEIVRNQKPFDEVGELENVIFTDEDLVDDVVLIKSFPNPFTNKITIEVSKNIKECSIIIFNMMGQVVKEEFFDDTSNIEIRGLYGLSNGVYVLKVVDGNNNELITRRIVKL
ncbi:T9SS type A sorting domain-containing protein [Leptobacterium flavescens]|uniref:T9SS type A sorting domain-containing protein n=1 Tax=Leptobacterium flavescens TaxID=472055 RepID=A0A6P0UL92_9FLAO|nr:tyrosinase family protein [Leptobacterium flavescens]NER13994.1 T9SS type A sorting domain-containing protein [Leptobacterium flavescens]